MYAEQWEKACSCDAPAEWGQMRVVGELITPDLQRVTLTVQPGPSCPVCGTVWRRVVPVVYAEASQP